MSLIFNLRRTDYSVVHYTPPLLHFLGSKVKQTPPPLWASKFNVGRETVFRKDFFSFRHTLIL